LAISKVGSVTTVAELLAWLDAAPAGTAVPAASVADALRVIDGRAPAPAAAAEPATVPWSVRLWQVPPQTRLGPVELLEAVGRPRSWLYRHTGRKAPSRIPHRKLDGALVFVVGEVRQWIEDHEQIVVPGRGRPLVVSRKGHAA
jgi:predicted DNA-binding transcriptional regulator AlpA